MRIPGTEGRLRGKEIHGLPPEQTLPVASGENAPVPKVVFNGELTCWTCEPAAGMRLQFAARIRLPSYRFETPRFRADRVAFSLHAQPLPRAR